MPSLARAARLTASLEPSSHTPAGVTPTAWSSASTSCRVLDPGSGEKHALAERDGATTAVPQRQEAGLRDPDDLVLEERLELDPLVGLLRPDDRELDAPGQQALEDLAARRDLDVRRGRSESRARKQPSVSGKR